MWLPKASNEERKAGGNGLVAVAVDSDKGSQSALKWAIENLVRRGQTVLLIHVRKHTSASAIDHSAICEVKGTASPHRQLLEKQNKELFVKFHCFCTRKDVHCLDVILENTDVVKALLEYVSYAAIESLVLGASSRHGFIRRFEASDTPGNVSKGAPDFCTVYVISKAKIESVQNALRAAPFASPLHNQIIRSQTAHNAASLDSRSKLSFSLKGNHSAEQPGLDWPARLKIVKGVARVLAHLQSELPSPIVAHGHLKSSNVLLDESFEPLYTLAPLVNQEHAQQIKVAYKSPEYAQHGRTTKKTDVWSLGILILEILTGKFPANYLAQGTGNLASWVESIIKDQETGRVFDKEMGYNRSGSEEEEEEEEMLKLFKIGVACCEEDVEKRWDLKEAVEKIEELKASGGGGSGGGGGGSGGVESELMGSGHKHIFSSLPGRRLLNQRM